MSLYLIVVIVAYLLGSIPFGFLLVWLVRKEDIRAKGSGNIGATNVLRSGAKGLGILTFVLDGSKGYAAVAVAEFLARGKDPTTLTHLAITGRTIRHPRPYVSRLAALQGWQRSGHCFWRLPGTVPLGGALRAWTMARCRGSDPLCIPGFHSGGGRASLPHPVAVAGQIWLRIRRGGVCLLLDGHREAPAKYRAPGARHGARLWRLEENRSVSRIAIVGSGSWGTALALSLARRGDHSIALWSHSAPVGTYLPGFPSLRRCNPVTDLAAALRGADIVISAVPSQHVRAIYQKMAPFLEPGQIIVSATKGIEDQTFLRMTQVIEQVLAADHKRAPLERTLVRPGSSGRRSHGDHHRLRRKRDRQPAARGTQRARPADLYQ